MSYFGVLTVGNNNDHCLLKNKGGTDIIRVNKNSQIVEAFSSLRFNDSLNAEIANPQGRFRGFSIQLQ